MKASPPACQMPAGCARAAGTRFGQDESAERPVRRARRSGTAGLLQHSHVITEPEARLCCRLMGVLTDSGRDRAAPGRARARRLGLAQGVRTNDRIEEA